MPRITMRLLKVLYYNMVQKPTAANPNYFELEICHKMYWQVQPTTVLKVEQCRQGGGRPPSKVSHDNAGGLLPAHAWQMDHEGGTARHTKLAVVVRYNQQRHGLVPIRPPCDPLQRDHPQAVNVHHADRQ